MLNVSTAIIISTINRRMCSYASQCCDAPPGHGLGIGGPVVMVGEPVVVDCRVVGFSPQVPDSSPRAAIWSIISLRTLALLETPSIPVGVPVPGKMTSGLE